MFSCSASQQRRSRVKCSRSDAAKASAVTQLLKELRLAEFTIHVAGPEADPKLLDAWESTIPGREGTMCLAMGATVDPGWINELKLCGDLKNRDSTGGSVSRGGEGGMGGGGGAGRVGGEKQNQEWRAFFWSSRYMPADDETTLEDVVRGAFRHHRNTNPSTDSRESEDPKSHSNLTVY